MNNEDMEYAVLIQENKMAIKALERIANAQKAELEEEEMNLKGMTSNIELAVYREDERLKVYTEPTQPPDNLYKALGYDAPGDIAEAMKL